MPLSPQEQQEAMAKILQGSDYARGARQALAIIAPMVSLDKQPATQPEDTGDGAEQ